MPRHRESSIEYEPQSAPTSPRPSLPKPIRIPKNGIFDWAKRANGAVITKGMAIRAPVKRALNEDDEEEPRPAKKAHQIGYTYIGTTRPDPPKPPDNRLSGRMTMSNQFHLTWLYETRGMPRIGDNIEHISSGTTYSGVWYMVDFCLEEEARSDPLLSSIVDHIGFAVEIAMDRASGEPVCGYERVPKATQRWDDLSCKMEKFKWPVGSFRLRIRLAILKGASTGKYRTLEGARRSLLPNPDGIMDNLLS